ncbi:MAG: peroxiredoxin family protein [Chloroflexi bacterium]|nr:peroxiredoxin family protein [Chloroflexota bacterium]
MDLQNDTSFQALDVAVLSIALDPAEEQQAMIEQYGITVPMLIDANRAVSEAYDVMQWAVGTGEPGHTFILVDESGEIAWIRDYGAPQNGGLMYVPIADLTQQIEASLAG